MAITVTERLGVHIEGRRHDPSGAATKKAVVAQMVIEVAHQTAELGPSPQFGWIGAV